MNKLTYKKIGLGVAFGLLFWSGQVLAQTTTPELPKGFCTSVSEIAPTVGKDAPEKTTLLAEKRRERSEKLTANRTGHDKTRAENRANADRERFKYYEQLFLKNETDQERRVVDRFKLTIESAVKTRRAAIDAAIQSFREELDQALNSKKSLADTALNDMKTAMTGAFTKAKSDCERGAAARDTFQATVRNAREKFLTDRRAIEKFQTAFQPIVLEKRTAIEKAHADFKTTLEIALQELKVVISSDE